MKKKKKMKDLEGGNKKGNLEDLNESKKEKNERMKYLGVKQKERKI